MDMSSETVTALKEGSFLPFKIGYVTPALEEIAKNELNETEETRTKGIQELREKISKESWPNLSTEDEFLIRFLRARKFNTDKAFELLQNFYNIHILYREVYKTFDETKNTYVLGRDIGSILPYRDHNGCSIVIIKFCNWNPDEIDIVTLLRSLSHVVLHSLEEVGTQICGIQVIVDIKGVSFKHVKCCTPYYIQLFSRALRNTAPLLIKHVHFCNESIIFQPIWTIFKLLASEKINERFHFHGSSFRELHNYIPKAILPSCYGGDYDDVKVTEWNIAELPTTYPAYFKSIACVSC